MNLYKISRFLLLLLCIYSCKKDKNPQSPDAGPKSCWTVNGDSCFVNKLTGPYTPKYVVEYTYQNNTDTSILHIESFHPLSPGFYTILNYNEYNQAFEIPGNVHLRVYYNHKVYRNYKHPVAAFEVIDSAGSYLAKITNVYLYSANDINDSILVNAALGYINVDHANWTINSSSYHAFYPIRGSTDAYTWFFSDTLKHRSIILTMPSLNYTDPTIEVFYASTSPGKASVSPYLVLYQGQPFTTTSMDTNRTATITTLYGRTNFVVKDYIILSAPGNDSFMTRTYWPDTNRLSADLWF